ncbi:MAG: hypothetical protein Q8M94_21240 [Ignavibacteria bacterium]|nr:hypothetical protein [Ignavibacteria bacterium]
METENINQNKLWIRNFLLSVFLHLLFIAAFMYFYGWHVDKSKINAGFFTLDTKEFDRQELTETIKENDITEEKDFLPEQKINKIGESKSISFSDIVADTTNLDQVYSEPTLNISIKYPKGWTFIDQNKNKKLDGVTFWASDGLYNPPPYIHLEVVNKEMFIEKRYSYKLDFEKYQAYYNDPEEMQDYVTQIIYIRTNEDEDFKLKLMMKGETEFKSFQPRFWAILKSFNFGSSLF